jgi:hypothetical protein
MLNYKLFGSSILCAVVLFAVPMIASARPKSETTQVEKKTIDLDSQATVDGKTLTPGKYEVLIEGNKVSFERDGQSVVTAPCDWKTLPYKDPYNSTTFSAKNVLQELQFEGSNQALDVM